MLEEVGNWRGWIPTGSHVIETGCDIGGGDGSLLNVKVSKKGKRFTLTNFGDTMFKSVHVFFWRIISDNVY